MVLAWTQDRVGPICRTIEDCAMVFHAIHGVDPKDPSSVTTPFHFDGNIDLSKLRIGVDPGRPSTDASRPGLADPGAPPELVAKLRELGLRPREIGPRPTVPGIGGGNLGVESAAAMDDYVQAKAKAIGLDLSALPPTPAPTPQSTAANPMAPADWNPRFVNGRVPRAFDVLQVQRRRQVLIRQWAGFMHDLDMFIGGPSADISANAQTGHPCVVFPYTFAVPPSRPSGARVANDPPPPVLQPQPVCATIVGSLYADDLILAVAHRFQEATDFHARRPTL
jgi:hypothetical protein